ncbi:MAG: neutral zinc metallopeptidase [Deltaproteobacteria bacterium]|nr:neutral zinc metallopeptidase [Kofleriaceae bacterium]
MKFERGHRSRNVEDRRGNAPPRVSRGVKLGGGGAILVAIIALIAQAAGVNVPGLSSLAGGGGGGGQPSQSDPAVGQQGPDPDAELFDFINYVVDDIQPTFAKVFAQSGKQYREAKLIVFREAVDTGCGLSSSAIGPFYCPPDEKAYIDLSFYKQLRADLGAPGDFAQAYVLAHEFGHHCQNVLGTDDMVRRESARDRSRENDLSVRMELQADCLAGVWAHSTARRKLIENGDIEEAIRAAASIGDDRLQKMAGQRVNPETFTHGSSDQRVRWFRRGYEQGTLEACDTFAVRDL